MYGLEKRRVCVRAFFARVVSCVSGRLAFLTVTMCGSLYGSLYGSTYFVCPLDVSVSASPLMCASLFKWSVIVDARLSLSCLLPLGPLALPMFSACTSPSVFTPIRTIISTTTTTAIHGMKTPPPDAAIHVLEFRLKSG